MSLKGGYKIIDLKGVDVTKSTMMIKGIYESIESNYGKPLLISGIVIDEVEKDDVFVQATLNGTAYEFDVYGYTIQVQDTDAVGVKTPTILGVPTEDITIELKNGDVYKLFGFQDYEEYVYTFKASKVLGVAVNSSDLTFDNLFYKYNYSDYNADGFFEFECIFESGYLNELMIIMLNNIIYITKSYQKQ